ncbi:unnamed protein product [Toxocara canis]|uniref:Transcriptional regulator n=1 Tax=Toxocara canis TaxID=6265 RepID=A0A183UTK6_TOXCA|nr:unnamed protein product [Toxocara canis]
MKTYDITNYGSGLALASQRTKIIAQLLERIAKCEKVAEKRGACKGAVIKRLAERTEEHIARLFNMQQLLVLLRELFAG